MTEIEFLGTAVACGANITGAPGKLESLEVVLPMTVWKKFYDAVQAGVPMKSGRLWVESGSEGEAV